MDDEIDIQDLAADEIRELLSMEGSELDEQQAAALSLYPAKPQFVEPQDQCRISSPAARAGYVLDPVALPQPVGIAEGRDAALGRQPSTAEHDYRSFPDLGLFRHTCTSASSPIVQATPDIG